MLTNLLLYLFLLVTTVCRHRYSEGYGHTEHYAVDCWRGFAPALLVMTHVWTVDVMVVDVASHIDAILLSAIKAASLAVSRVAPPLSSPEN